MYVFYARTPKKVCNFIARPGENVFHAVYAAEPIGVGSLGLRMQQMEQKRRRRSKGGDKQVEIQTKQERSERTPGATAAKGAALHVGWHPGVSDRHRPRFSLVVFELFGFTCSSQSNMREKDLYADMDS